jgi:hypothetical protein
MVYATERMGCGETVTSLFKGFRRDRNHPAESQAPGMENSLHPQSKQTRTSGEGVIGGWLMVRNVFR